MKDCYENRVTGTYHRFTFFTLKGVDGNPHERFAHQVNPRPEVQEVPLLHTADSNRAHHSKPQGKPEFLLKSCPRCGGDMHRMRDIFEGAYWSCVQCSFQVEDELGYLEKLRREVASMDDAVQL